MKNGKKNGRSSFENLLNLIIRVISTSKLIYSQYKFSIKAIKALIKNSIWKSSFDEGEKELAIEKWKED